MKRKVKWEDVYSDFRARHPNLKKMVMHWEPYDYLTIIIYISDGQMLIYDYINHTATFLSEDKRKK